MRHHLSNRGWRQYVLSSRYASYPPRSPQTRLSGLGELPQSPVRGFGYRRAHGDGVTDHCLARHDHYLL